MAGFRFKSHTVRPVGATSALGRVGMALFFSVFLFAGLGFGWFVVGQPLCQVWQARNWVPTSCQVISSEVLTDKDSDGDTYKVQVVYAYEFQGRSYQSDRYQFLTAYSSGRSGKAAVVARYPAGSRAECYVNPAEPSEAVIERGLVADLWFGLLPMVFVLVGAGGIVFAFRSGRRSGGALPDATQSWAPKIDQGAVASRGFDLGRGTDVGEGRDLKPSVPPWGKLVVAILVTAFWNGIVSVFVVQLVKDFQHGRPEWFQVLFMTPFVLIGLGMVGWCVYAAMALFNPRPKLRITPGSASVGGMIAISWGWTGRASVLEHLEICIEGREEATYRRGTDSVTDKSVFARLPLLSTASPGEIVQGRVEAAIPAGTMHSFQSANNKIVWCLQIHGRISRWPDVKEEYPILVKPAQT